MIINNSFFIETYGCSFNEADSQQLSHILVEKNLIPSSLEHSEFIFINSCAVKSQTQEKILHRLRFLGLEPEQKLIILGCLPWISDDLLKIILNINTNIIAIIDSNSLKEDIDKILSRSHESDVLIIKNQKNLIKTCNKNWLSHGNVSGIVQIAEGCTGKCSFCCTRISRGPLISYNPSSIILKILDLYHNGMKELFLTAQDCGLYNWNGSDLLQLLNQIHIEFQNHNDLIFRVGMLDPTYLVNKIQKIVETLCFRNFYQFLHIPIQSASDRVLSYMNRGYKNRDITRIFDFLSQNQSITVSTDIICGFPGESEVDFEDTIDFIKKYQPDIINISKFTPRPNTNALKLKLLDSNIVKKRTERLTGLHQEYIKSKNQQYLNKECWVLVTGYNPKHKYPYSGRNKNYKPIVLKEGKLGKFEQIKIVGIHPNYLIAEII